MPATRTATVNSADATPAVRIDDLRIVRGGRTILDRASLCIPRGSVVAVLGPSGAGKSTLLHAITGELAPARGTLSGDGSAGRPSLPT